MALKRLAFFDFDRTLLAADSQREEALSLLKSPPGIAFLFRLLRVALAEPFYKRDLLSYGAYYRLYLSVYKGVSLNHLKAHGQRLYHKNLKPRLLRPMMDRLCDHRQRGDGIVIVSATSEHLIAPFIGEIKPDAWKATAIEVNKKGLCTGRPHGEICVGQAKANALLTIANQMGVAPHNTVAYSDHHADLEFLKAAGNAYAVNPTTVLKGIAMEKGWKILTLP